MAESASGGIVFVVVLPALSVTEINDSHVRVVSLV
jgi:hypothetical protein